jgi:hypothetical protein
MFNTDEVFKLWEANMRIQEEEEAQKSANKIRKFASIGTADLCIKRKAHIHRVFHFIILHIFLAA